MKSTLQEVLERAGYETSSYSGRGMYGKTCISCVIQSNIGVFFSRILFSVSGDACEREDVAEAFIDMKTDSLGYDTVVYFPGTEYSKEDDEEDQDSYQDDPEGVPSALR